MGRIFGPRIATKKIGDSEFHGNRQQTWATLARGCLRSRLAPRTAPTRKPFTILESAEFFVKIFRICWRAGPNRQGKSCARAIFAFLRAVERGEYVVKVLMETCASVARGSWVWWRGSHLPAHLIVFLRRVKKQANMVVRRHRRTGDPGVTKRSCTGRAFNVSSIKWLSRHFPKPSADCPSGNRYEVAEDEPVRSSIQERL